MNNIKDLDHKLHFSGSRETQQEAIAIADSSLKKNGNFGVYGNLTAGLYELLRQNHVWIEDRETYYLLSTSPDSGTGHDFSMAIDKNSLQISELVVGEVIPPPTDDDNSTGNHSFDSSPDAALHYDEFLGPMFFEPYAIEVAERIDPSSISVALEIAAGTGRVTRHLRKRISASAKLIASDISETMLTVAKEKLAGLDIDWQKTDAQQLPFSDNSIDLVVCCFGYMFVPDKSKAFAEAYRVLRPGGMFLITTWDRLENNGASYTSRSEAMKYFEGPLPESFNLATSMHDEDAIRKLLAEAGFSKISVEKVQKSSICATAREAATGLVQSGQIFQEIKKRNAAWVEEIRINVEKLLAEKFRAAPMVAPLSALISQAWK